MYKEAVLLPVAPSRSSRVDVSQSEDIIKDVSANETSPHLFALLMHRLEHGPIAPLAQLADDVKHLK